MDYLAKIIVSPLFVSLIVLMVVQVCQLVTLWDAGTMMRAISVIGVISLALLSLLSTPVGSQIIYRWMTNTVNNSDVQCPVEVVVVLGGGYVSANDRVDDQLNGESILRVLKGIQVWRECDASLFIVSGKTDADDEYRNAELMRDIAVQFGVPEHKTLMETESTNTREHPVFIRRMKMIDENNRMAVVTSPWHMPRAVIEFRRYFSDVVPVGAYFMPRDMSLSFPNWLPQVEYLEKSVKMLQELVGIMWYKVLNVLSR